MLFPTWRQNSLAIIAMAEIANGVVGVEGVARAGKAWEAQYVAPVSRGLRRLSRAASQPATGEEAWWSENFFRFLRR